MRTFNKRERDIIKLIAENNIDTTNTFQKCLQEKYYTINKGRILILNHIQNDVLLYLKIEDYDNDEKRAKAIGEFWELVTLVSYLIETRYLTILPLTINSQIDFMYEGFQELESTTENITFLDTDGTRSFIEPDKIVKASGEISFKAISLKDLYKPVQRNIFGVFYPSQDIKALVKNNFRSEEEIKFRKQFRLSWVAIVISFLVGVSSIVLAIVSLSGSLQSTKELNMIVEQFQEQQKIDNDNELSILKNLYFELENQNMKDSIIYKGFTLNHEDLIKIKEVISRKENQKQK